MSHSVLVVGAGQIAGGYDVPGGPNVLTHLHAIRREPRFSCAGIVDLDRARAEAMAQRWGVPVLPTLAEALVRPFDVAVVAVPDSAHAAVLEELLRANVRLVLCEKPLALDAVGARRLVADFARAGRSLLVNYQRRLEPTVLGLRATMAEGTLGRPLAGAVWYSKGVLHNGSHAVDMLRFLFGEVRCAMPRRRVDDFTGRDPTVAGTLAFSGVEVELIAGDERCFSLFEIDLLFERGRYRFQQSGMLLERMEVRPDPVFPGYMEVATVERGETGLRQAMLGVWQAIGDHLDSGAPVALSAAAIIGTQIVCEGLQSRPLSQWFTPEPD